MVKLRDGLLILFPDPNFLWYDNQYFNISIYLAFGGIRAVAFTDVFQFTILVSGHSFCMLFCPIVKQEVMKI